VSVEDMDPRRRQVGEEWMMRFVEARAARTPVAIASDDEEQRMWRVAAESGAIAMRESEQRTRSRPGGRPDHRRGWRSAGERDGRDRCGDLGFLTLWTVAVAHAWLGVVLWRQRQREPR
jgi:hypothetical protein